MKGIKKIKDAIETVNSGELTDAYYLAITTLIQIAERYISLAEEMEYFNSMPGEKQ